MWRPLVTLTWTGSVDTWRQNPYWKEFKNEWEESSGNWRIQANVCSAFFLEGVVEKWVLSKRGCRIKRWFGLGVRGWELTITCLHADGNDPGKEKILIYERMGRLAGIISLNGCERMGSRSKGVGLGLRTNNSFVGTRKKTVKGENVVMAAYEHFLPIVLIFSVKIGNKSSTEWVNRCWRFEEKGKI